MAGDQVDAAGRRGLGGAPFAPRDWALLSGIALIWGSSFVLIEVGLRSLEPAVVTLLRLALGTATLAIVPRARHGRIDREDLPRVALLGAAWVGVPLLLFPIAQQWVTSSVAGMINGAVPLAAALWGVLLLRIVPRGRQLAGLVVGFAGIVAISLPELPGSGPTDARGLAGIGLLLVATLLYGLAINLAVPLQQRYGALPVLLRAQLVGLVVVAPFGLAALDGSRATLPSLLAMVPLGVLGTGLAFVMMAVLVGRTGSTRGSVAIFFVPVVAIALGVAFLGERPDPLALAGSILVVSGAWTTSRSPTPGTTPVDAPTGMEAS